MSFISRFRDYAAARRAANENRRTRVILEGLPADIKKDIGYPAEYEHRLLRSRL